MHCHGAQDLELATAKNGTPIVLVGNPNVGKSVIFGLLTGRYVTVSNYPGTTVELAQGVLELGGHQVTLIDTPGVNTLTPLSEDERVTRDVLLQERPAMVVQVADAKNLRRALLISLQLAEMRVPFLLDLNMDDEARQRGVQINTHRLSEILGVEVVSTVATRGQGLDRLVKGLTAPRRSHIRVDYGEPLQAAIASIEAVLREDEPETDAVADEAPAPEGAADRHEDEHPLRALALMWLAGDDSLRPWLEEHFGAEKVRRLVAIREQVAAEVGEPLGYVINRARLATVDDILAEVYTARPGRAESPGEVLGRLAMHPLWGLPILAIVLFLVYKFVGEFGAGTLVDFIESVVFGEYINPWVTRLVEAVMPGTLLAHFLVGEYGLITMALTYAFAIVLPIVGTFFLAFGVLEDSGYMPRLAVMVNRAFKFMGLNGKAALPMILGLGCDTMATMTARILETRKERIQVTLLLALGVPCSAQLGVILGMLSGLEGRAVLIWGSVVVGVLLAVGFLAARVIPGESSDFILELPPLRMPQWRNLVVKTAARMEWYLREVVPLFILGTTLLFFLDLFGWLGWLERLAAPLVVNFLGLPAETTSAFVLGFLRRDYGAAGFFVLARQGLLSPIQVLVSIVTLTLFVPCIANVLMIVKEQGWRVAVGILAFVFPMAFMVGGALNLALRALNVSL
jgi:ferrous iron transport protein B